MNMYKGRQCQYFRDTSAFSRNLRRIVETREYFPFILKKGKLITRVCN